MITGPNFIKIFSQAIDRNFFLTKADGPPRLSFQNPIVFRGLFNLVTFFFY